MAKFGILKITSKNYPNLFKDILGKPSKACSVYQLSQYQGKNIKGLGYFASIDEAKIAAKLHASTCLKSKKIEFDILD